MDSCAFHEDGHAFNIRAASVWYEYTVIGTGDRIVVTSNMHRQHRHGHGMNVNLL